MNYEHLSLKIIPMKFETEDEKMLHNLAESERARNNFKRMKLILIFLDQWIKYNEASVKFQPMIRDNKKNTIHFQHFYKLDAF
jgi:hypothetical protein